MSDGRQPPFLALRPFDHVVVSTVHLLFGRREGAERSCYERVKNVAWLGGAVGYADIAMNVLLEIQAALQAVCYS